MHPTLGILAGALLALAIGSAARADDPAADDAEPVVTRDQAEVYIEAPGARLAVDEDEGRVDIRAGNTRIYADESGRVDIRAPAVTIQAEPN